MTSSGVPVGDTTLLQRLTEAEDRGDWTPQRLLYLAQADEMNWLCDALNALPAVVTLIEAAHLADISYPHKERFAAGQSDIDHYMRELRAALAPFVGETTQ